MPLLLFITCLSLLRCYLTATSPVVTLNAKDDWLVVAYHVGAPNQFSCNYVLCNVDPELTVISEDVLPLTYPFFVSLTLLPFLHLSHI